MNRTLKTITAMKKPTQQPLDLLDICDNHQSLNHIKKFFAEMGWELARKIQQTLLPLPSSSNLQRNRLGNSMGLWDTDDSEIEAIVVGMHSDAAVGVDGISINVIKLQDMFFKNWYLSRKFKESPDKSHLQERGERRCH